MTRLDKPAQRVGERRPVRIEDREVESPVWPGGGAEPRLCHVFRPM